MAELPETILQFGSGKFLRGFADLFVHQANAQGQGIGRIVVVQTTGDARANLLTDQAGRYHVPACGLFEQNADPLCQLLVELVEHWPVPAEFASWLGRECGWHNALVDRIVTAQPVYDRRLHGDALAVTAEPYALWAIEVKDNGAG